MIQTGHNSEILDPDSVFRLIVKRKSTRSFLSEPMIDDADIMRLIESARWAPSASNQQPWHFLIIKGTRPAELTDIVLERFDRFCATLPDTPEAKRVSTFRNYMSFMGTAPVLIGVLSEPYKSFLDNLLAPVGMEKPWRTEDVHPAALSIGAAIQNMLLTAESLDYATCWLTGPLLAQDELESALDVRKPRHLVSLIAVGKQADNPVRARRRTALSELYTIIE